jgi:hypothetical protein
MYFPCPYLCGEVELTREREQHILERHPELLSILRENIYEALKDPDFVYNSSRFKNAKLFYRWFNDLRGGKYVVVVVVSNNGISFRHWIITAYITRKIAGGESEWKKN